MIGPKPNDCYSHTKAMWTNTHRDEEHEATETEIRVMQLQTKECQGLPAATRSQEQARKGSSLEPSEGAWPC